MLTLLHEHNSLNGFRFVLIEFGLVALIGLFFGAAELFKGSLVLAMGYIGIAVNAITICATVIGQMRRGERSGSLRETYSAEGRKKVESEHPNLGRHTLLIVLAVLVPFLLTALVLVRR